MKIVTQKVKEAREIYDYMSKMTFPYNYVTDYKTWGKSYLYDIDGDGRTLFSELETMGGIFGQEAGRIYSIWKDRIRF